MSVGVGVGWLGRGVLVGVGGLVGFEGFGVDVIDGVGEGVGVRVGLGVMGRNVPSSIESPATLPVFLAKTKDVVPSERAGMVSVKRTA